MDELNGKMIACQILVTGLIARVANDSPDPLRFLTSFRDEIKAVVKGINIAGIDNTDRVRLIAQQTVDELFSLMKPPSIDWSVIGGRDVLRQTFFEMRTLTTHFWNDSKLKFVEIPDLEGFKSSFEGFELTPRFAPDTTDVLFIEKWSALGDAAGE
jgi:hypothetical protein